jgi:cytochrome c oxidase subunit 2
MRFLVRALACVAAIGGASAPLAAAGFGHPVPDQIGFQRPVTPIAHELQSFHNHIVLPVVLAISVFVALLLLYVIFRFNERVNPEPSKTTHNTLIEVIWAVVPVMILIVIAIPSFRLLTDQLVIPPADLTVKVTGNQWYWSYEYPKDQGGGFKFDSLLKQGDDLKPDQGDIRLLSVDNVVVVPVNKIVRVQVTASDVIHSFVVQSFGIRIDAVPGRLNETWFKAEREGTYYGQCSKLCGKDHAFMPIEIKVVSQDAYTAWLADAKKKYASTDEPIAVAGNTPAEPVRP